MKVSHERKTGTSRGLARTTYEYVIDEARTNHASKGTDDDGQGRTMARRPLSLLTNILRNFDPFPHFNYL